MSDSGAGHGNDCKECNCFTLSNEEYPNSVESGDSADSEVEKIHKSLACFIVGAGLPFEMVESIAFLRLMYVANPNIKLPSAETLSKICYQLYLDEKLKLQSFMKSNCESVCLSTEVWNSPYGITYTGITAHFIDENWKLQRKALSFFPNDYRSKEIGDVIEEWQIKKVCTITMDNTKTDDDDDDAVCLKEKLVEMGIGFSGGKYLEVKCIVRGINSVVVEALEKAKLSVDRVRNAVNYVKYRPDRLKKFKECIEAEKIESTDPLLLDFCPMWNFTYVMLSRAEKYEKAFDRYAELDPAFKLAIGDWLPTSLDWSVVRQLTVVLKPFHDIMLSISKSSNLTSNKFWVDISDLYAIFLEWQNGNDLELQAVAEQMRSRLEEYFGGYEKMNKIVYIASVLDPRCKFEVLEYSFSQIYGEEKGGALFKDVKKAMLELFNEYDSISEHKAVDQSNSGSSGPSEERKNIFMALYKKRKLESEDAMPELEVYLNEPMEDDGDGFDILEWWKCNAKKFPVLSAMARDILAIPESGVRREYTFDTSERMLEGLKCHLDSDVLQGLMCGQDWLGGPPPKWDSIEEYDEDNASEEEMEADELGSSWGEVSDSD